MGAACSCDADNAAASAGAVSKGPGGSAVASKHSLELSRSNSASVADLASPGQVQLGGFRANKQSQPHIIVRDGPMDDPGMRGAREPSVSFFPHVAAESSIVISERRMVFTAGGHLAAFENEGSDGAISQSHSQSRKGSRVADESALNTLTSPTLRLRELSQPVVASSPSDRAKRAQLSLPVAAGAVSSPSPRSASSIGSTPCTPWVDVSTPATEGSDVAAVLPEPSPSDRESTVLAGQASSLRTLRNMLPSSRNPSPHGRTASSGGVGGQFFGAPRHSRSTSMLVGSGASSAASSSSSGASSAASGVFGVDFAARMSGSSAVASGPLSALPSASQSLRASLERGATQRADSASSSAAFPAPAPMSAPSHTRRLVLHSAAGAAVASLPGQGVQFPRFHQELDAATPTSLQGLGRVPLGALEIAKGVPVPTQSIGSSAASSVAPSPQLEAAGATADPSAETNRPLVVLQPEALAVPVADAAAATTSAAGSPRAPEPAPAAVAAPVLQHAHVAPELARALNECLQAPRLMSAEEYRATYPAFDSWNEDYMAYRQRWQQAEREQRDTLAGVPGAPPRATSRSLLCTPSREVGQRLEPGSSPHTPIHRTPLTPLRTLSPCLQGSFGYRGESVAAAHPVTATSSISPAMRGVTLADRTAASQPDGSPSSASSSSSAGASAAAAAPLYLPAPVFHEDLPAELVHRHSVMAFLMESSRSTSLRATPLEGFLVREEHASKYCTPVDATRSLNLSAAEDGAPGAQSQGNSIQSSPLTRRRGGGASGAQDGSDAGATTSPLLKSFQPKQFSSNVAQTATTTQEQPAAFVPVLPATHAAADSGSNSSSNISPESRLSSRIAAAGRSLAPLSSSRTKHAHVSSGTITVPATASSRASHSASATNTPPADLFRRSLSDGVTAAPLSAGVVPQGLRSSSRANYEQHLPSAVTASPGVFEPERVSGGAVMPDDGLVSSLPGTPAGEDDSVPGASTPSAAVLRSQAHIASVTRSWQEQRVEEGAVIASAQSSFSLPSIAQAQSQASPSDPRYAVASAAVAKKLTIPAASRLRAVKNMSLPPNGSDGGAAAAGAAGGGGPSPSASSLPPQSPKNLSTTASKRRLLGRNSSGTTSGLGSTELPNPGARFDFSAAAAAASAVDTNSPQQMQRRRLLQQLAANSTL